MGGTLGGSRPTSVTFIDNGVRREAPPLSAAALSPPHPLKHPRSPTSHTRRHPTQPLSKQPAELPPQLPPPLSAREPLLSVQARRRRGDPSVPVVDEWSQTFLIGPASRLPTARTISASGSLTPRPALSPRGLRTADSVSGRLATDGPIENLDGPPPPLNPERLGPLPRRPHPLGTGSVFLASADAATVAMRYAGVRAQTAAKVAASSPQAMPFCTQPAHLSQCVPRTRTSYSPMPPPATGAAL